MDIDERIAYLRQCIENTNPEGSKKMWIDQDMWRNWLSWALDELEEVRERSSSEQTCES